MKIEEEEKEEKRGRGGGGRKRRKREKGNKERKTMKLRSAVYQFSIPTEDTRFEAGRL